MSADKGKYILGNGQNLPSRSSPLELGSSYKTVPNRFAVPKSMPSRAKMIYTPVMRVLEESFSIEWRSTVTGLCSHLPHVIYWLTNMSDFCKTRYKLVKQLGMSSPCPRTAARPCSSWHIGSIPVDTATRPGTANALTKR